MGTAATLDFQRLLAPIVGASPAGADLRDESLKEVYYRIKGYRDESSKIERNHLLDPANDSYSLGRCRWAEVVEESSQVLAERSKDHEIAAWLCEALVRQNGFAGLRDGLRLARELAGRYWDCWRPPAKAEPAQEDAELRPLLPFAGLFRGVLVMPIRQVPLTEGEPHSELDYEQAKNLEKITDAQERQARVSKGQVTLQQFEQHAKDSSTDFYRGLADDLQTARSELEQLCSLLKEKYAKEPGGAELAPSPREVIAALEGVAATVRTLAGDRLTVKEPPQEQREPGTEHPAPGDEAPPPQRLTREVAFKRLREIAEFFRAAEPHSPVSHHLEEAIRWGDLSLPDLLAELIPEEKTRKEVFTRIGITPPPVKK